jgi:hypothetical protein
MKHYNFLFIKKSDYSSTFDPSYKDLIITYDEKKWHYAAAPLNIYFVYEVIINRISSHTGIIDFNTMRRLLKAAWTGDDVLES